MLILLLMMLLLLLLLLFDPRRDVVIAASTLLQSSLHGILSLEAAQIEQIANHVTLDFIVQWRVAGQRRRQVHLQ